MSKFDQLRSRLRAAMALPKTSASRQPLDVAAINNTIQRALTSAGLQTQSGPMQQVTDTIQQALSSAGLAQNSAARQQDNAPIDVEFREATSPRQRAHDLPRGTIKPKQASTPGQFLSGSLTNPAGTRTYKLYIPTGYRGESGEPMPLLVMLHGCTQTPDDFAAGTGMNTLAEQQGLLVVYPAQAANANGQKCWNWFRPEDQARGRGEPSLIADITREVASRYRVDARRIYVAGLSAGAAMAVVLGTTYPELFAAVGAHSGLPYAAAHDMPSAFGAMRDGGAAASGHHASARRHPHGQSAVHAVPAIVFHGDRDTTVDARNSDTIVEQASARARGDAALRSQVFEDQSSSGRHYRRTVHTDPTGQSVVEHWLVHGAGHAWSGGHPSGSFTDAQGPDASAEMIRFFLSQRSGTA